MTTIHLVVEANGPDPDPLGPGVVTTETNLGRTVKILRIKEENRKKPPNTPIENQEEGSQTGTNKTRIVQENPITRILPHAPNKKVSPKRKVA